MIRTFKALLLALATFALAACSNISPLVPVPTEVVLMPGEVKVPAKQPGQTYVLVFNNANKLLFGPDNTARINMRIDGKGVGGLDVGHFAQFVLPNGRYTVTLLHQDVGHFTSTHELVLTGEHAFVEIWPTPFSNGLKVHAQLPEGNYLPKPFQPYRP